MPNPGAQLEFTAFSDEFIAWENRAALQAFFEDIRVPAATVDDFGSVKKAEAVTYNPTNYVVDNNINLIVDGVAVGLVPTKGTMDEAKEKLFLVQSKLQELLQKLRTAGILDEV